MCAWRRVEKLEKQLVILTPQARERWSILVTMLEMSIDKIKKGKPYPVIIRPWEIDDKGHHTGSIRNAIDEMRNNRMLECREDDVAPYDVSFSSDGIDRLFREIDVWKEMAKIESIDTSRRIMLEIIEKLLHELKSLIQRSVPQKS